MHIEMEHLEGYSFAAAIRGHRLLMDTQPPMGRDTAPSPKELLLASILGCSGLSTAVLIEAVTLSLTKYCGVSAMVNEVSPIHYAVEVNGATVATGEASFA
jgi:putative redox protein